MNNTISGKKIISTRLRQNLDEEAWDDLIKEIKDE